MRILTSAQVTTPNDEASRTLAEFYPAAMLYCLEQGHWKFASKIAELTPSVTELPTVGYTNAFAKPANYVRLNKLCTDEYFQVPLPLYDDRAGFWYADEDTIYVDYVSSEATLLGGYLAGWPETFSEYVSFYLAFKVAFKLKPDEQTRVEALAKEAKANALSKDAVLGPTVFLPPGRWTSARGGRQRSRSSNSSFYGT